MGIHPKDEKNITFLRVEKCIVCPMVCKDLPESYESSFKVFIIIKQVTEEDH